MNCVRQVMTIAGVIASLLWLNTATARTHTLVNCSQLEKPNSVLLVHASWCSYCQHYLPVYKAVSNRPDMKKYTFYVKRNDATFPVCGVAVRTVPVTFTHNMGNTAVGALSKSALISFVKD